ncbi:DUF429 domain-containing protein [Guyparkeria sp. 1SP6A2]|nr:DUF429 domain-containing protein [Guyparkeria sp. 1SP6A2]
MSMPWLVVAGVFGMPAIESAVAQLAGSRVKEDDMLDAFAVLWSARRQAEGGGARPADADHFLSQPT